MSVGSPEVVHSYTGQRMSGYISDRLVSNNFSGNATHIHFFAFEFFEHKGNTTCNLFEYSEIDLKSSIIVVIPSKLERSPIHF
jgi:hypothetical protein